LDSRFKKLWEFEDFSYTLGRLSAIVNATISPQNYPKLPKSTHRQNFEIPPKIEILVFSKNKNFYL
jgi:hypothetical protein